nr:uncharacterized protein LOC111993691 [Quercus suber]
MGGDSMKRSQSLHCQYHQERGHTTENCRTLWNHLEQRVRDRRLKQFLYQPNGQGDEVRSKAQGNASSRPLLGTINVIFVAPRRTGSYPSRVMSVAQPPVEDSNSKSKRAKVEIRSALSFLNEDKIGTIQPHNDTLVVTLKIEGYDVKKVVIPRGEIRLPVQADSEIVEVDFIVVDTYSPYTTIVARPWLHALGTVSSTLHLKVKYSSGDQVEELVGS